MQIKDYLPFYIGTPILICEPGIAPVYHYELEGYDKHTETAIAERVHYPPEWIRPILLKPDDVPDWFETLTTQDVGFWIKESLKNGLDLFGLIDAGLAIYRKDLHKYQTHPHHETDTEIKKADE